jgi:hypothetical protein
MAIYLLFLGIPRIGCFFSKSVSLQQVLSILHLDIVGSMLQVAMVFVQHEYDRKGAAA